MICDLCKEDSYRIVRVNSWQVCQWCVSNKVLEHALVVEFDIAKLREAIAKTDARHELDVKNEMMAGAKLELAYTAYSDLTTAMKDLATSTAHSKESLRLALSAKKALTEYTEQEQRKTRKARQGKRKGRPRSASARL
jgi:hypothetical protein